MCVSIILFLFACTWRMCILSSMRLCGVQSVCTGMLLIKATPPSNRLFRVSSIYYRDLANHFCSFIISSSHLPAIAELTACRCRIFPSRIFIWGKDLYSIVCSFVAYTFLPTAPIRYGDHCSAKEIPSDMMRMIRRSASSHSPLLIGRCFTS